MPQVLRSYLDGDGNGWNLWCDISDIKVYRDHRLQSQTSRICWIDGTWGHLGAAWGSDVNLRIALHLTPTPQSAKKNEKQNDNTTSDNHWWSLIIHSSNMFKQSKLFWTAVLGCVECLVMLAKVPESRSSMRWVHGWCLCPEECLNSASSSHTRTEKIPIQNP